MSNFRDVGVFHRKFDLPASDYHAGPKNVTRELLDFRVKFMHEELTEFMTAADNSDIAGMADALIDLVYVAMGTAHVYGFPWQALWDEVQRANMAKERATHESQSTRLSTFDVVKPEGWQPPAIAEILKSYGFEL